MGSKCYVLALAKKLLAGSCSRIFILVLMFCVATAGVIRAQCFYLTLNDGSSVNSNLCPSFYRFTQTSRSWTAISLRPDPGSVLVMGVYGSTADFPQCVSGGLTGTRSVNQTDFVLGDFNHNPSGTYYVSVDGSSGSTYHTIEWDSGNDVLLVNTPRSDNVGPGRVDCYDVSLQAGTEYRFGLTATGGNARLLMFQNPQVSPAWCWRSSHIWEIEAGSWTTFTAGTSDNYALVVVNDGTTTSSYAVICGRCSYGELQDGVEQACDAFLCYYKFTETPGYWGVVSVRTGPGSDSNMGIFSSTTLFPECLTGVLATSSFGDRTDFVVGDFNHSASGGTYYVEAERSAGASWHRVRWQDGQSLIGPDYSSVQGALSDGGVVCYDLQLEPVPGENTYRFQLSADEHVRMLLFRNPGTGPFWAGRSEAILETGPTGCVYYTASSPDRYALVIVNDGTTIATYRLDGPTDLTFTSASAAGNCGYVTLTWQMGVEVSGSSFLIKRSESKDGEYVTLDVAVFKDSGLSFSCTDFSVQSGKNYWYKIVLLSSSGEEVYGPIEVYVSPVPVAYWLHQSHPNPFNPACTIRYEILKPSDVSLTVFDVSGSLVHTLVDAWREPGAYSEHWDGRAEDGTELPSGVYFYRLEAGDFVAARKLVLLRE